MTKQQRNRQIKRRITIFELVILLFIIIIIYIFERNRYKDIFFENTTINGVDCSLLTIEEAKERIQDNEEQYILDVIFKDNEVKRITGTEIELTIANLDKQLNMVKKKQQKNFLFRGGTYKLDNYVYNSEKLKTLISSKRQLQKDYMERMTKIQYVFNSNSKCFEIVAENIYYLDINEVTEKISKSIEKQEARSKSFARKLV